MTTQPKSDALVHLLATLDTGDAYSQFHGWTLQCLWCEHSTQGKTKREALEKMQAHYDRFDGVNAELR